MTDFFSTGTTRSTRDKYQACQVIKSGKYIVISCCHGLVDWSKAEKEICMFTTCLNAFSGSDYDQTRQIRDNAALRVDRGEQASNNLNKQAQNMEIQIWLKYNYKYKYD